MTLLNDLKLNTHDLSQWGVVMPDAMADAMAAAQEGQQMRVSGVRLVDGRAVIRAETLTETQWFQSGFDQIDWTQCQCLLWPQCLALIDKYTEDEFDNLPTPPEWTQIAGAGLGPVGAEDGWPVGAHVLKGGHVWVSRVAGNVNEPLVDVTSTWSRKDGTYVVPAGWRYQPDEEVTEDGGATWFRALQAVSQSPSSYPAGYVQIDGRGGDSVSPPEDRSWVQPTGEQDAYTTGDLVTHDNPNDNGAIWIYESKIDANTTEPGRDGTFDRWWEPVSLETEYAA